MNQTWNTQKYSSDFSFVPQYGNDAAALVDTENVSTLLDLGCGNGRLSKLFADKSLHVTGLDSSQEMLATARADYPEIEFIHADAADFTLTKTFDAVFSNAVLHWIDREKQPLMMKCVHKALKTGGQFVFEMGGSGCAKAIHSALIHAFDARGYTYNFPFYFPSVGEYASLLENNGFKVVYALLFDRPTALKGEDGLKDWIRMFVSIPFRDVDAKDTEAIISEAAESLRPQLYHGGTWYADYVRLRVKAVKA